MACVGTAAGGSRPVAATPGWAAGASRMALAQRLAAGPAGAGHSRVIFFTPGGAGTQRKPGVGERSGASAGRCCRDGQARRQLGSRRGATVLGPEIGVSAEIRRAGQRGHVGSGRRAAPVHRRGRASCFPRSPRFFLGVLLFCCRGRCVSLASVAAARWQICSSFSWWISALWHSHLPHTQSTLLFLV